MQHFAMSSHKGLNQNKKLSETNTKIMLLLQRLKSYYIFDKRLKSYLNL